MSTKHNQSIKTSKKPVINERQKATLRIPPYFIALSLLIITTFIVYKGSLNNEFVNYDDTRYIQENKYIQDLSVKSIANIFSTFYAANYHPLTTLTWSVEYAIAGTSPFIYHLNNLLLHLINILLVFYWIKLLTTKNNIALIACALFALHPLHVESVAWVSERKDVLYTTFYLLGLIFYHIYHDKGNKFKYLVVCFLSFALSCLSKSMAVTFPIVLLLIDYYAERKITVKSILEKVPFFALSIIFGVIAIISQKSAGAIDFAPDFSLLERPFLIAFALVYYIGALFIPSGLSVVHYYPERLNGYLPLVFYISAAILLGIAIFIWKIKKFKRVTVFGSLMFLVSIALVIQIIPVGKAIVAERYTYMPYLGIFLIIGFIANHFYEQSKTFKTWITTFFILVIILFSIISWQRTQVWKDGITLFEDVLSKNPNRYEVHWLLGNAWYEKGEFQKSLTYYDKTIALKPDYAVAYNGRGYSRSKLKDYDGAIADLDKAIELKSDIPAFYHNRGNARAGKRDFKGAIEDFNKAIQMDSTFSIVYNNRGQAYEKLGDISNALSDYNKSIQMEQNPIYYYNRGNIYDELKENAKAEADLTSAIQLFNNYGDAYNLRGIIKAKNGRYQEALSDFSASIRINSKSSEAWFNRGMAYIELKLQNQACTDLKTATELGNMNAKEALSMYCK